MGKLSLDFYLRSDVVQISRELLGKELFTKIDGEITSGIITETEAYAGFDDRASHAFGNRRTSRTEVMYAKGGTAYVYLCYGIHHLFNVVCNVAGVPHAVLIRAIAPSSGLPIMLKRRKKKSMDKTLSTGPGTMSQALGIRTSHSGLDLCSNLIWIQDSKIEVEEKNVTIGPRIGVDYAGEDALLPYRFRWNSKISR
ncbi:MAG: 3-methyladenine DNA glycosylase [Bacteroidetes bacterium]|nr:MAG: 3-methyladenine DNA glycosylase [Bacteroidota bacterium]